MSSAPPVVADARRRTPGVGGSRRRGARQEAHAQPEPVPTTLSHTHSSSQYGAALVIHSAFFSPFALHSTSLVANPGNEARQRRSEYLRWAHALRNSAAVRWLSRRENPGIKHRIFMEEEPLTVEVHTSAA
jgi:hypothetical protein